MVETKPLFIVQVADRKTGEEEELRIRSDDQAAAMTAAMEQGWLVVSVRMVPVTGDRGRVIDDERRDGDGDAVPTGPGIASSIFQVGILSTVIGIGFFVTALALDTAPDGVHNIGLLNRATVFGLMGMAGIVSGAVLCAAGGVGGHIIRLIESEKN